MKTLAGAGSGLGRDVRRRARIGLVAGWALALALTVARGERSAPRALFDGETLQGWTGNTEVWRVEDGAITGEIPPDRPLKKNEFLFWEGELADFELTLEFRLSGHPSANSGIQIRSQRLPDGDAAGLQADLDMGAQWLGRIYDEHGRALLVERGTHVSIAPDGRRWVDTWAPPESFQRLFKPDDWNTYRITAKASHLEIWVNGERVSALDDHQVDAAEFTGSLALQLHSGPGPVKLQFRNLQLVHLGQTEAPATVPAYSNAAPPPPSDGRLVEGEPGDRRWFASPVLWHLQSNPAEPRPHVSADARHVVENLKLMLGFSAELVAAEPDVHQPIAFAIDERGRLWVAEAYGYPVKQPNGQGQDRILIFADEDGDGSFETRKVFAEGLNLVSGLEVGFGGVFVGAAPELLFIPDRDRDDRPDGPPEVLLDGWGFQDTHETLNSFTWGPDGWLYGNQGVFVQSRVGRPGTSAEERQSLRAAVWRYHPVRRTFEVYSHGGSNQWGIDFNLDGHLFLTHCRSFHGGGGTTYAIRNGHFWNQTNSDYPDFISNHAPDFAPGMKNLLPASARYDSGEGGAGKPGTTAVYGGHSHVGTMIYLGDNWPEIYRDHLFTHNLHGRQINHQHNVRRGSGYETFHAGYDLLFSPDLSYLPVDLQYGPDGAVYVIDWCDEQHCHHPLPEAWNRTNGRIYRLAWAATDQRRRVDLGVMSDRQLAELHTHRNEWFVRTARRLLQERASSRVLEAVALEQLRTLLRSPESRTARLRALWTLHVTGALQPGELREALRDPEDVVRAWAVTLGTEIPGRLTLTADELAVVAQQDESAHVRLAVASTLPLVAPDDVWRIGAALASHPGDVHDRFLPKMIWFGLARVARSNVARALALANETPLPTLADSIRWFIAGTTQGREQWARGLAEAPAEDAARQLRLFGFALETQTGLAAPAAWPRIVERFANSPERPVRQVTETLSAVFGDETVRARMRRALADRAAAPEERRYALQILHRVGDAAATPAFIRLLEEPEFRSAALPFLGRRDEPEVAEALLRHLEQFNEAQRSVALGTLTSRPGFAEKLLQAVQAGTVPKQRINALHIRQMRALRQDSVDTLVDEVWGAVGETSADAQATIARLKTAYGEAPLWAYSAERGKTLYQQLCAACHALDGQGGALGPELTGSWRNGVDYFLENIVDPNAVIGIDYQLNLLTLRDGSVVSGMLERETDTLWVIRTISETVRVPKADVVDRQALEQSLMPPGLLEALSEREMIELLKYLTQRRE